MIPSALTEPSVTWLWLSLFLATPSIWFWSWLLQEFALVALWKSGGIPTSRPLRYLAVHFLVRTFFLYIIYAAVAWILHRHAWISRTSAILLPAIAAVLSYGLKVVFSQIPAARGFTSATMADERGNAVRITTLMLGVDTCLHTLRLPGGGRFHIFHAGESHLSVKVLSMASSAIEIAVCTSPRLAARSCPPPLWAGCFASRIRVTERSGGRVDWEILEEEPRKGPLDAKLLDGFTADPGISRAEGRSLFVYPKAEAVAAQARPAAQ